LSFGQALIGRETTPLPGLSIVLWKAIVPAISFAKRLLREMGTFIGKLPRSLELIFVPGDLLRVTYPQPNVAQGDKRQRTRQTKAHARLHQVSE